MSWYNIVNYKFQLSFYDKQFFYNVLKFWLKTEINSFMILRPDQGDSEAEWTTVFQGFSSYKVDEIKLEVL